MDFRLLKLFNPFTLNVAIEMNTYEEKIINKIKVARYRFQHPVYNNKQTSDNLLQMWISCS